MQRQLLKYYKSESIGYADYERLFAIQLTFHWCTCLFSKLTASILYSSLSANTSHENKTVYETESKCSYWITLV